MVIDSGNITSWALGLTDDPAGEPAVYPWQGLTASWQANSYGGPSQVAGVTVQAYVPEGDPSIIWEDATWPSPGSMTIMPFGDALAVVAGDPTLLSMHGSLLDLAAGATYTVATRVWSPVSSPAVATARYRLVTNIVASPVSPTVLESPPLYGNGVMAWSFTVPAGTAAAYVVVENMYTTPNDVVWFDKPSMYNTSALGILGLDNAVPIRTLRVKMPPYYRKAGWPTAATYLMDANPQMVYTPSAAARGSATADPTTVTTAADLRYLAVSGYTVDGGGNATWTAAYTSGLHSMTLHSGISPIQVTTTGNSPYSYLRNGTVVPITSLRFDAARGTWLYSDDLDALGLTEYTVIMALAPNTQFISPGGLWSSVPKAAGGGPDTTADLTTFNYRSVGLNGPLMYVDSLGMGEQSVAYGRTALMQRPTYLAFTFRDDVVTVYYADEPSVVNSRTFALSAGITAALSGSVVLGADATQGLVSGDFSLFEMGIYFTHLTSAQVQREIRLIGSVYG